MFRQPIENPNKNNKLTRKQEDITMELEKQTQEFKRRQLQQQIDLKDLQEFKLRNLWPIHTNDLQNISIQSDITGESYAESSSTTLQRLPTNKHYTSRAMRQLMEKRRTQLLNLPTHSSDSSFEDDRLRIRDRFLRRKSKLEREMFWRKYNDFLARSIDYMESNRSSSSSSD